MRTYVREFRYSTKNLVEVLDVTTDVEKAVSESGVKNGVCLVFVPHATAAVIANESEAGLVKDIVNKILELFPRGAGYLHDRIDDNANSHLAASFLGASRAFPVVNGRIVRGTWQNILLVELDGPRGMRRLVVTVIGD